MYFPDAELRDRPPVPATLGGAPVSKLYLFLIVIGVLMTLAWIAGLICTADDSAQRLI